MMYYKLNKCFISQDVFLFSLHIVCTCCPVNSEKVCSTAAQHSSKSLSRLLHRQLLFLANWHRGYSPGPAFLLASTFDIDILSEA